MPHIILRAIGKALYDNNIPHHYGEPPVKPPLWSPTPTSVTVDSMEYIGTHPPGKPPIHPRLSFHFLLFIYRTDEKTIRIHNQPQNTVTYISIGDPTLIPNIIEQAKTALALQLRQEYT